MTHALVGKLLVTTLLEAVIQKPLSNTRVTVAGDDRGGLKFQWKSQKLLSFSAGSNV